MNNNKSNIIENIIENKVNFVCKEYAVINKLEASVIVSVISYPICLLDSLKYNISETWVKNNDTIETEPTIEKDILLKLNKDITKESKALTAKSNLYPQNIA